METLPEKYVEEFNAAYQKAANKLVREFTTDFCGLFASSGGSETKSMI